MISQAVTLVKAGAGVVRRAKRSMSRTKVPQPLPKEEQEQSTDGEASPAPTPYESSDESLVVSPAPGYQAFLRFRYSKRRSAGTRDALIAFNFCRALDLLADEYACNQVRLAVQLMHRCGYVTEDIQAIFALALGNAVIMRDLLKGMQPKERVMVAVIHVHLAHAYVQDDYIPLRVWHSELFEDYCSARVLDSAMRKLWSLRDYRVGIPQTHFEAHMATLTTPVSDP
mmetsp:Transcript_31086/g.65919  ORF Transcript_31086/g.65919 Transcript_31086/m.65919 type:complete len:227 (-) Transcript_31086:179-859(-)|eukprot:CAMPEP_0204485398 /NCGR_PEP_ID=MMETSP0471-20130131/60941_1 /ASSEMBLY_ACC=CAM_ASM_000602 /TAXON_ID=2969 /ORGANISM="Oxyrrhis marina" /LENGTH=226 /DNA_ID=CAMNT_0051488907 /DNA_START=55 /DNA_END=735 /DNA_ORIENTATION=-